MGKLWWFFAILFMAMCLFIALLPSIGMSIGSPAYRLYIYNLDSKHYYEVRVTNQESRWTKTVHISPNSCEQIERMEIGEYTIRTFQDGGNVGDYATFEITGDDLCIKITSVTGMMDICENTFCY